MADEKNKKEGNVVYVSKWLTGGMGEVKPEDNVMADLLNYIHNFYNSYFDKKNEAEGVNLPKKEDDLP